MSGQEAQRDLQEFLPGITKKPWGHEKIVEKNDLYVVKEIYVKAGHRLSLQYHLKKIETMFLIDGKARLYHKHGTIPHNREQWIYMKKFIPYFIDTETIHRLEAAPDSDCLVVEVSSTELDDVVRLEDDYGRR